MIRLAVVSLALAAGLCGAALAQTQPTIAVTGAWARATPGGAKTGAAYVTVTDSGTSDDTLVGAATPVAAEAQLHTMTEENGVMKMRPLAAIAVKPGSPVVLKPGGMHIMLMGLKQPLTEGQTFPLTLKFAKAGTVETTVKVAKAGAMSGTDMGGMKGMNMGGMNMK